MSQGQALEESWRTLRESLDVPESQPRPASNGGGEPYVWRALFSRSGRPLLVPATHRAAQESSLRFFITRPRNRLFARVLLRAERLARRLGALPEVRMAEPAPGALLQRIKTNPATEVAFHIGTPGPYQKATLLLMSPTGEPLTLAKLALNEDANPMVDSEAYWLEELARHGDIAAHVPRLLQHGKADNGRDYVLLSIVPGRETGSEVTPAHRAFLAALAQARLSVRPYSASSTARFLDAAMHRLDGRIGFGPRVLLTSAMRDCARRLRTWYGPCVIAHGDFASWNIRRAGHGISVFDWEYASDEAIALQDIMHFCLAPRAVADGTVEPAHLQESLQQAEALAQSAHAGFAWSREIVALQALAYLLHTVLFYSLSRDELPDWHPLVQAYLELIRTRAQWAGSGTNS
ncbi:MAG TPA: phosphotransferase [Steroidobacteraceae bacterium]|nr:phosphotransferase [Steroidobacteraceae bacterium]